MFDYVVRVELPLILYHAGDRGEEIKVPTSGVSRSGTTSGDNALITRLLGVMHCSRGLRIREPKIISSL